MASASRPRNVDTKFKVHTIADTERAVVEKGLVNVRIARFAAPAWVLAISISMVAASLYAQGRGGGPPQPPRLAGSFDCLLGSVTQPAGISVFRRPAIERRIARGRHDQDEAGISAQERG